MADARGINVNGSQYELKDVEARSKAQQAIDAVATKISGILPSDTIAVASEGDTRTLSVKTSDTITQGGVAIPTQSAVKSYADTAVSGKQDANTAVTHTASTAVGSANTPVYVAANGKATAITKSTTPTSGSANPITSGAVYTALQGKQDTTTAVTHTANTAVGSADTPVYIATDGKATAITKSTTPTSGSANPITSGAVYTALQAKQNTNTAVTHTANTAVGSADTPVYIASTGTATAITKSTTPTSGSANPITSGAVYTALQGKQDTISDATWNSKIASAMSALFKTQSQGMTLTANQTTDVTFNLSITSGKTLKLVGVPRVTISIIRINSHTFQTNPPQIKVNVTNTTATSQNVVMFVDYIEL